MEWFEQRRIGENVRAGVAAGALVELHIMRDSDRLGFGTAHEAIVREQAGARQRVDVAGSDAWLVGSPPLALGTRLAVQVVRAPIAEPGQIKRAHVVAHRGLAPVMPEAQKVQDFPDSFAIEEWCDRAISGDVPFAGGALSLERTRAGLVIDVDGSGTALEINMAAIAKIAEVLRLFQVGGMVMVDFVSPENRDLRHAFDAALEQHLRQDPRPFERTAMNGFGLVQIVRAKKGPSLMDILCSTRRHTPSIQTQALRLLDDAARSKGAGPRTLTARPEMIAYIESHPALLDELRLRIAADVRCVADATTPGHGHVHVMPL